MPQAKRETASTGEASKGQAPQTEQQPEELLDVASTVELPPQGSFSAELLSSPLALLSQAEGIDVSNYQGHVDWPAVRQAGKVFTIVLATQGTYFHNAFFPHSWQGTKDVGILRGAYHFWDWREDPVAQADFFVDYLQSFEPADLPPSLDLEEPEAGLTPPPPSQHIPLIRAFLDRVEQRTGRVPIIYTYPDFWMSKLGNPQDFVRYPLWISHTEVTEPWTDGWSTWMFWQYSHHGSVPGVAGPCLLDRFNGTEEDLRRWVGGTPSVGQASGLTVAQHQDGRLELVTRARNGELVHMWQSPPSGWSPWHTLGANVQDTSVASFTTSDTPAVGYNQDGRIEVFVRGSDNQVYHAWQDPNSSSGWSNVYPLGGDLQDVPAVGRNTDGRMEVFARGTDGQLWHAWQEQPNGGWSNFYALGGYNIQGTPLVGRAQDGRLEVFARGGDNQVYHKWQTSPGGEWVADWHARGSSDVRSNVVVGYNPDGRMELFVRWADNQVYHCWQHAPNGDWSDWYALGWGNTQGQPVVGHDVAGRIVVFARGNDNQLWHIWQEEPGGGWAYWDPLGGDIRGTPTVARNADGRMEVFARGADNLVWDVHQIEPGGNWTNWYRLAVSFADVPDHHQFWREIEAMYASGVTTGCRRQPMRYCPNDPVTRDQMAVFVVRAKNGASYTPPAAQGLFADVDRNHWMAPFIEQFYRDGITTGCAQNPLRYCPTQNVTRDQMAVFLVRALHGGDFVPPAAEGIFADVDRNHWMAPFIEQFYRDRITTGCAQNPLRYCPTQNVTRAAMAAFLTRAFNLPTP